MSARLAPRPTAYRGSTTRVGAHRDEYSATVEGRPSRFAPEYADWAARADAWTGGRRMSAENPRAYGALPFGYCEALDAGAEELWEMGA